MNEASGSKRIDDEIGELEELLVGLEAPDSVAGYSENVYSEDDEAITQSMSAPLGARDWMVQYSARSRKMLSTEQLLSELEAGALSETTLVWRGGMDGWVPISAVDELTRGRRSSPPSLAASAAPQGMSPTAPQWGGDQPLHGLGAAAAGVHPSAAPVPPPPLSDIPSQPDAPTPLMPPPPSMTAAEAGDVAAAAPTEGLPARGAPVAAEFSSLPPRRPLSPSRAIGAGVLALAPFLLALAGLQAGGVFDGPANKEASAVGALQPAAAESAGERRSSAGVNVGDGTATEAAASATPATAVSDTAVSDTASAPAEAALPSQSANAPSSVASPESSGETSPAPAPGAVTGIEAKVEAKVEAADDGAETATVDRSRSAAERSRTAARRRASRQRSSSARLARAATSPSAAPTASMPPAKASAAAQSEPAAEATESESAASASSAEAPKSSGADARMSGGFNRSAAQAELDAAARDASKCRPPGGPTGAGRVQVRYEPTGKVAAVAFLTPGFEGTTAGSCVRMVFRRARVEPFGGNPVVLTANFEIP